MKTNNFPIADRYWIPKGSNVELTDGFFNPDAGDLNASRQRVSYHHSLDTDVPCMVLLGPPGIGKSTEFHRATNDARAQGCSAEFVSLSGIYTSVALVARFIDTAEAGDAAFVFMDALDESPVTVPVVQQWILSAAETAKKLGEQHGRKVLIRLSARTADWSDQFELQLQEIWGKDSVQVFELSPFTRDQALSVINQKTPHASEFLDAIVADNSGVLASRPVTLRMLLNSFLAIGTYVAEDKISTYRRGILALLEESNRTRRASGATGDLDAESRFILAGRIAAASELSTRAVIWDGLYSDAIPPHAVPISEIAGGVERAIGDVVAASPKNIRETLRTGLFRPTGDNTYEWAHKTFAEFLAAYYITAHGATAEKIFSLIRFGLSGNDHVVPQLREVAAWLSALDHKILEGLVAQEPGLLLSSDVALESNDDRKMLVRELVKKLDGLETYDKSEWRHHYQRLNHPELGAQLGPIIRDREKNIVLRRTAIDIAEACSRTDLLTDLREIAFDATENDYIRAQATHALTKILPSDQRQVLIPLAIQPGEDADDEIKGWALTGLWPNCLTARQLFGGLSKPKNESLIGSYASFLYDLEIEALSADGALAALEWLSGELFTHDLPRPFSKLIPSLLTQIWGNAEDPDVLKKLAEFVLGDTDPRSRLRHESDVKAFEANYLSDTPEKRRTLVLSVFRMAPEGWKRARLLTFLPWKIVAEADLPWLVDELLNKSGQWPDEWLIDLIIALIHWEMSSDIEYVLNASDTHDGLKRALDAVCSIPLDSDLAKWMREEREEQNQARIKANRPSRKETVLQLLHRSESAELGAFWQLNLALLEDDAERVDEFTGVLAQSPGWGDLSSNERKQLVQTAKHYLNVFRLKDGYLQPSTHNRPAAAGYRAFRLLLTEDPDSYRNLSADVWSSWALPILSFSSNDSSSEQETQSKIAHDCYHHAPSAFLSAVSTYLAIAHGIYHVVHLVRGWGDESVLAILWNTLDSPDITDQEYESAFEELIESGCQPAVELGYQALKTILDVPHTDIDKRTIHRASTIVGSRPKEAWQFLSQIVEARPEVARDLITSFAIKWRNPEDSDDKNISAAQRAQLYVWIESLFERRQDASGERLLRATDETFYFQKALLRSLIDRGSAEGVAAVSWIAGQLSHIEWLRWSLEDARENQRRVEWTPLSPRNAIEQILGSTIDAPVVSDKERIVREVAEDLASREPQSAIDFQAVIPDAVQLTTPLPPKVPSSFSELTYLVVNDEWSSGHGGISTFNRQLCIALAQMGHKVFCFIPRASPADIDQAAKFGVDIVVAGKGVGLSKDELLARGPSNRSQIMPDAVIGHDHITGAQALALAREEFDCPYLHFIHTSPEEIEEFKCTDEIVDYSKGSFKARSQIDLCCESDVVLAVGPKLESTIRTSLVGRKGEQCIVLVLPGLDRELLRFSRPSGRPLDLICLLSGRLNETLIKGADLFVRIAGKFQSHLAETELRKTKFVMRGFEGKSINDDVASLKSKYGVTSNRIIAREYVTDEEILRQDLKSASSFLMPSKTEGFGLTGLDAIAAGIPTIVTLESGLGVALVTISGELSGDLKHIAADCVLDTQPDGDEVLQKWVEKLSQRLSNPGKAFSDADDLRKALLSRFSWSEAAKTVTEATLLVKRT